MIFFKNRWFNYFFHPTLRLKVGLIFLFLTLSGVIGFYLPKQINDLFESFPIQGQFNQALILLGGLFVFEFINRLAYNVLIDRYIVKILQMVRIDTYSRWLVAHDGMSKKKEGYPLGEVIARLMSDTEAIKELVSSGALNFIFDLIFIGSGLASFLLLNSKIGIFLIFIELGLAILLLYGSRFIARSSGQVLKAQGKVSAKIANLTGGIRDLYYTPHHAFASRAATTTINEFLKKQLNYNIWDASYFSFADSLYPLMLCVLVLLFPNSMAAEVALIAVLIDLIQRSISPIKDFASKVSDIQRAGKGIERLDEFWKDLVAPEQIQLLEGPLPAEFSFQVRVPHFSYQNREGSSFALNNLLFTAHTGKLVGIAGRSGSGKSTFLKILSADLIAPGAQFELLDFQGQQSLWKGSSPKSFVSLVSQDSHLFSESLAFNLSFEDGGGVQGKKLENFWDQCIAEIPYIQRWGLKLSDPLHLPSLSSGQKQLIAALRACYLKKPVVLFDEISSGLDGALEMALRKLIEQVQSQAITIVVAHRLETILEAQVLYLFDQGKIVANGTHPEMLNNSKLYQDFIEELKKT